MENMYRVRAMRERNAKLPYLIALALMFWTAFLMSLPAKAEVENNCHLFGDMVYQMAKRRDEGMSIFEMREIVRNEFDKIIIEPSLALTSLVYERPWLSPSLEAEQFLSDCLTILRGRGTEL